MLQAYFAQPSSTILISFLSAQEWYFFLELSASVSPVPSLLSSSNCLLLPLILKDFINYIVMSFQALFLFYLLLYNFVLLKPHSLGKFFDSFSTCSL